MGKLIPKTLKEQGFFSLYFEIGSCYVAQAGLKPVIFCLSLPTAEIRRDFFIFSFDGSGV
jgi:hypothetical protein